MVLPKTVAHLAALAPLALLLWQMWAVAKTGSNALGADPVAEIEHRLGLWALRFLVLALAVTPLRQLTGWAVLVRFRRMLGLFVFFYALLHLLAYAWFDMGFDGGETLRDIAKRPFILMGVLAFLLLAVLAATSFDRAIRALGGKRWRALHRAVYAVAILAVLHFYWMRAGKNDFAEVLVYGVLLAMLLGWRVSHQWRRRRIEAAQRHAVSAH